ncbi:unnamed protein product [Lampetra fluviatilis]
MLWAMNPNQDSTFVHGLASTCLRHPTLSLRPSIFPANEISSCSLFMAGERGGPHATFLQSVTTAGRDRPRLAEQGVEDGGG